MKKHAKILSSSLVLLSLALTSCASYRASPLTPPVSSITTSPKEKEISVVSKAFTKRDCQTFFDRDVIAEGYQPVQIYIQNNSDKKYLFSLDRLSLPIARAEEVAEKVHTSTIGRIVGYSIGALFLWPFVIPAVIDGIKSAEANDALDDDFAAKAARDGIILPYSAFNAVVFVPKRSYQNNYTVTLIDQENKAPKEFAVIID
jgi:hypothetical protein